jgi:hypothetical protein
MLASAAVIAMICAATAGAATKPPSAFAPADAREIARPGKVCASTGGSAKSPAIGSPLDGLPDTPGPKGNEVNDILLVTQTPPVANGRSIHLGYVATTFNHEQFYQFPVLHPGTTEAIVLNIGRDAVRPAAQLPAATWRSIIDDALSMSRPADDDTKTTIQAAKDFESHVRRSGTVSIVSCFAAPWDGPKDLGSNLGVELMEFATKLGLDVYIHVKPARGQHGKVTIARAPRGRSRKAA